ncbi:MAG: SufE family protein [Alphaproteobacteria bacterium]|nr:SufE family protein [Alphaproteobacteria bacterium]
MSFQKIIDDFSVIDDWEERYRYIIELGRKMPEFSSKYRTNEFKVRGCASQVWLFSHSQQSGKNADALFFSGDSDAIIVRGLIALLLLLYSGKTAHDILATDARALLGGLGLDTHLSQQRSNGLFAMVERIQADACRALKKD